MGGGWAVGSKDKGKAGTAAMTKWRCCRRMHKKGGFKHSSWPSMRWHLIVKSKDSMLQKDGQEERFPQSGPPWAFLAKDV